MTAEKKRTGQGNSEYRLFEALQGHIKGKISTQVGFNMYILLTKRKVKMAGYWPSSLFAFLSPRRSRGP